MSLSIRRYDPRDARAVRRLNGLAFEASPTDPSDIPGTEDLDDVTGSYLDAGGDFLVGVLPPDRAGDRVPRVHDGALAAMGGVLPCRAGHEDERSVAGAAELHRMRVAPAHQRSGFGRELLAALEDSARAAGLAPVLATTARRQTDAVAFYAAAGYRRVEESVAGEYELVHFEKSLDGSA